MTTRFEVDALSALDVLGAGRIVHDLQDNERLCPTCKGVGIHKTEQVYGLATDPERWRDPFPYRDQWLTPCRDCYLGKREVCPLCDDLMQRGRLHCECAAARAQRDAAKAAKEGERLAKLPRIKLADYELDQVYCDDHSEYILVDDLDDHDDCTIFACVMAKPSIEPAADGVIDEIERMADEKVEDGAAHIRYTPHAKEALDVLLAKWFAENVETNEVYWPNRNLIVEIPDDEPTDE